MKMDNHELPSEFVKHEHSETHRNGGNDIPMLQIGWKAGPEQYPPTELCDYAVIAEQAGFDTIDGSDHFHPWSEAGQELRTRG